MAKRRPVDNLLALAVLSVVAHRPMHPYEMAAAIKGWGKDRDMPVKWGSLYSVVGRMTGRGLLAEAGTERQGNRPERTVYRITEAGRAELVDWARELLSAPEREFPRFRAGLSVAAILPPEEVMELLRARLSTLDDELTRLRDRLKRDGAEIPRLFLIEDEYDVAMIAAEADWTRSLLSELESGSMPGIEQWRRFHDGGPPSDDPTEGGRDST